MTRRTVLAFAVTVLLLGCDDEMGGVGTNRWMKWCSGTGDPDTEVKLVGYETSVKPNWEQSLWRFHDGHGYRLWHREQNGKSCYQRCDFTANENPDTVCVPDLGEEPK